MALEVRIVVMLEETCFWGINNVLFLDVGTGFVSLSSCNL